MHSVKCLECGMVNWSSEECCKRCGTLLSSFGGTQSPADEKSSSSPWKKVLVILLVVAAPVAALLVLRKWETRHGEFAEAIQSSPLFIKPVTVEATKTAHQAGFLNTEAETLYAAGLLIVLDEPDGTISVLSKNQPPRSNVEYPFAPPPEVKFDEIPNPLTKRRLIPKDVEATRDWTTFEDPNDQRSGFIVPVGSRQLDKITSVEKPDTITARVHFTWYWKPNDVGRHFDFNAQERAKDAHGRPKSSPELSSDFPYKGTADLSRNGAGWEVKSIDWNMKYTRPLLSR